MTNVRSTSLAYSLVDEFFETASDWASSTPYWVLFVAAGILVALFIIGLVKKFVVTSVLLALLLIGACSVWFFSGSSLSLN